MDAPPDSSVATPVRERRFLREAVQPAGAQRAALMEAPSRYAKPPTRTEALFQTRNGPAAALRSLFRVLAPSVGMSGFGAGKAEEVLPKRLRRPIPAKPTWPTGRAA